jgi:hypothetical protein
MQCLTVNCYGYDRIILVIYSIESTSRSENVYTVAIPTPKHSLANTFLVFGNQDITYFEARIYRLSVFFKL